MSHAVRIVLKDPPGELDGYSTRFITANKDGTKIFFLNIFKKENEEIVGVDRLVATRFNFTVCRLEIVREKGDIFDGTVVIGGNTTNFVNFYSITDDFLGIVIFDHVHHRVYQYMFQLVSPRLLPTTVTPTTTVPIRERGQALAVCIRRNTLGRANGKAHISLGLLYSGGRILVCGEEWSVVDGVDTPTLHAQLIAANPMKIDRYPDADLTKYVAELSLLARKTSLWLLPFSQLINDKGIHFFLRTTPTVTCFFGKLLTHTLGVLYLENGRYCGTQLVTVDTSNVVNPEEVTVECFTPTVHTGGTAYFKFVTSDGNRAIPRRRPFLYSLNVNDLEFRRISSEECPKIRINWRTMNDLRRQWLLGSPNGALIVVKLPFKLDEKIKRRKIMHVTLLWEPSNPPPLKTIAERTVMSHFPAYKSTEFRREYGQLVTKESVTDNRPVTCVTRFAVVDFEKAPSNDGIDPALAEIDRFERLLEGDN